MASNIAPLQLPEWRPAPMVDWRPLNEIGQTVADYRNKNAIAQAIQQANGNPEAAGNALGAAGFTDQAKQYLSLAQQKAAMDQQAAFHRDSMGMQGQTLAESKREHDILAANAAEQQRLAREQFGLAREKFNWDTTEKPSFKDIEDRYGQKTILQTVPNKPASVYYSTDPNLKPGTVLDQNYKTQNNADTLSGEDYLKTLPPGRQALLKQIASYEKNPDLAVAPRGPAREAINTDMAIAYPGYVPSDFPIVQNARKYWEGEGKGSQELRQLNVAMSHLELYKTTAEALKNTDIPKLNALRQIWERETGSPIPTNVQALVPFVSGEVAKAVMGMPGGVGEREEFKKPLDPRSSPEQISGAIHGYQSAIGEQLMGREREYTHNTKRDKESFRSMLNDHALSVLRNKNGEVQTPKFGSVPIPIEAARELQANPTDPVYRASFDKHFGAGAADRVLGPQK